MVFHRKPHKKTAPHKGKRYKATGKRMQPAGSEAMFNKTPSKLHQFIAPHYYTHLMCSMNGIFNNAALPASQSWSIMGNGQQAPFNTALGSYGAISSSTGFSSIPATLALSALNPVGYHALKSIYNRQRTYAQKIRITLEPSITTNPYYLCVFPVNTDEFATVVTDFQLAQSLPYSKTILCSTNNTMSKNTLTSYVDFATLSGLTKLQYKDEDNNQSKTSSNPVNLQGWIVLYQAAATTANSASDTLMIRIDLESTVEFFEPVNEQDIS